MEKPLYSLLERIEIADRFDFPGEAYMVSPYGGGHINDTFAVETKTGLPGGAGMKRYILQRINTKVFTRPADVLDNIKLVTGKLHESIRSSGGDPLKESLTLIGTKNGKHYLERDSDGTFWRCYHFIEGARTYDFISDDDFGGYLAYQAAFAFGQFQNRLAGLPAESLHETLTDFHHTPARILQFEDAITNDRENRIKSCKDEIEFARKQYGISSTIVQLVESGKIPRRVTHNDTKVNNVMFDYTGSEERARVIIDLDTVMPGASLYDFGDLVRTTTCPAAEDERDLSKIYVSMFLFEQLVKGWLDALGDKLSADEIVYLPFAGKLITFNIGIRFLTDYLNGDAYFHVQRPGQNLDRSRVQFEMIRSMESQADTMEEIVEKVHKNMY